MKIFYIVDDNDLVIPVCDWAEDIEPEEDWKVAEIEGKAYESHWVPLYKDVNGVVVARTAEEIQADIDEIPFPEPTETDQLRADVDYLTMENDFLEDQVEQDRADIDYLLMITEEE